MTSQPAIVWNAAGLSPDLSGIERLAVAYPHEIGRRFPEVHQTVIAERRYEWLDLLPAATELRLVPHFPATILVPRWSGRLDSSAWHSWANPVLPRRGLSERYSFTVHDWTPFEPGTMKWRHRALWRIAMQVNLATASAVHFTTADAVASTPHWLRPRVDSKEVLVGGDVPTLPNTIAREPAADPYVIAVGTHIPRKRFKETVDLWMSNEMSGQPRLILVGRGTDELGESKSHSGLGYLSDAELGVLIAGAEAGVCLSDREGLNLPVRETLRAGVPVIGTIGALGTLQGSTGVTTVRTDGWRTRDIATQVIAALAASRHHRERGARIGADLSDGEALGDFLVSRAQALVAGR